MTVHNVSFYPLIYHLSIWDNKQQQKREHDRYLTQSRVFGEDFPGQTYSEVSSETGLRGYFGKTWRQCVKRRERMPSRVVRKGLRRGVGQENMECSGNSVCFNSGGIIYYE